MDSIIFTRCVDPDFKTLAFKKSKSILNYKTARSTALALSLLMAAQTGDALAAAFDSHIIIKGSAAFDSSGTPSAPSNSIQNGSLTSILGGVSSTTTLNAATINGPDPLVGTLTNIGDGFGIGFNASGNSENGPANVNPLFGDYTLSIQNNSLVDSFLVSLKFEFSHQVNATDSVKSASDNGEFAKSQIGLYKADGTELVFSQLISDTINDNQKFVFSNNQQDSASGFGGVLSDVGSILLSFLLNPGDLILLGDNSPDVLLAGAADSGNFSASTSTLLSVDSVVIQTTETVPEPETLLLLAIGLLAHFVSNRRHSGSFSTH